MAICLSLHGELYVVDTVVVTMEVVQLFPSMGPGHKGVVHVSESTEFYG
jgi:hypothetical protein